jgi:hypothetical protein
MEKNAIKRWKQFVHSRSREKNSRYSFLAESIKGAACAAFGSFAAQYGISRVLDYFGSNDTFGAVSQSALGLGAAGAAAGLSYFHLRRAARNFAKDLVDTVSEYNAPRVIEAKSKLRPKKPASMEEKILSGVKSPEPKVQPVIQKAEDRYLRTVTNIMRKYGHKPVVNSYFSKAINGRVTDVKCADEDCGIILGISKDKKLAWSLDLNSPGRPNPDITKTWYNAAERLGYNVLEHEQKSLESVIEIAPVAEKRTKHKPKLMKFSWSSSRFLPLPESMKQLADELNGKVMTLEEALGKIRSTPEVMEATADSKSIEIVYVTNYGPHSMTVSGHTFYMPGPAEVHTFIGYEPMLNLQQSPVEQIKKELETMLAKTDSVNVDTLARVNGWSWIDTDKAIRLILGTVRHSRRLFRRGSQYLILDKKANLNSSCWNI